MNSLMVRKASGRRLVLISAATLLYANSALTAQPAFDAQAQARQVILAKPNFGVATDSKTSPIAAVAAQANLRVDAQEQARQFILTKPNVDGLAGRVVAPPTARQRSDTRHAPMDRGSGNPE